MRVLFDTNVLVSAIVGIQNDSPAAPAEIFRRWESNDFELVVSDHILRELARTMSEPFFASRVSQPKRSQAIETLRHAAIHTGLTADIPAVASHPEDDLVLAAAASGNVDYLVTGDVMLQRLAEFSGISIVSPKAFLLILEAALLPPDNDQGMLDYP